MKPTFWSFGRRHPYQGPGRLPGGRLRRRPLHGRGKARIGQQTHRGAQGRRHERRNPGRLLSHTGALAGSEQAYQAAFGQAGIIRAGTVEELLDWCHALSCQPLPTGDGMAVLTNAGGPGVLAVDALQRAGAPPGIAGGLHPWRAADPFPTRMRCTIQLTFWRRQTPGYADALGLLLADKNVSGVVVLHVPHVLVDAPRVLEAIGRTAQAQAKPVVASLFGDYAGTPGIGDPIPPQCAPFTSRSAPAAHSAPSGDTAGGASNPRQPARTSSTVDREAAAAVINEVRLAGRLSLTESGLDRCWPPTAFQCSPAKWLPPPMRPSRRQNESASRSS